MAELTLWNLGGAGSASVLQRATGERNGRVAYTKHADILGELDVVAGSVTEYAIPAALHAGAAGIAAAPAGVAHAGPDTMWCALANGHALVRLEGAATLRAWPLLEQGAPFVHPWHVDAPDPVSGVAWFAGTSPGTPGAPVIGRVDPASGLASYWKLAGLKHHFPTDVRVQGDPLSVWITFKRSRVLANPCLLARLDVATGVLTTWHAAYTSAQTQLPMGSFGLAIGVDCSTRRIWSTFYDPAYAASTKGAPESAVHRLDLDTGIVTEYATGAGFLPGCVTTDADDRPWFGTLNDVHVGVPTCGVPVTRSTRQTVVKPSTLVLQERTAAAAGNVSAIPGSVSTLVRQTTPCLVDYPVTALANTWMASIGAGTPAPLAPATVYFAAPSTVAGQSGHIGRLAV